VVGLKSLHHLAPTSSSSLTTEAAQGLGGREELAVAAVAAAATWEVLGAVAAAVVAWVERRVCSIMMDLLYS
jgi:hypothetical protein